MNSVFFSRKVFRETPSGCVETRSEQGYIYHLIGVRINKGLKLIKSRVHNVSCFIACYHVVEIILVI